MPGRLSTLTLFDYATSKLPLQVSDDFVLVSVKVASQRGEGRNREIR